MYAIVEIAGQQFKVEEGKKIFVHRLEAQNGNKVEFDQVLLIEDKGKIVIGEPVIKDALVEGKVLDQLKGDKVLVFKKKRKKGYRVKNGHRQYFTQVEIVSIKEKAVRKAAKAASTTPEEAAAATVSEQPVAEKKAATKKAAVKNEEKTEKGTSKKGATEEHPVKKSAKKPTKSEE
ncbi:MAG TPA: 50S ribosomal protein L21 [Bacteroidales bacterium]|nr:50S ribosomal protein L21 [Bacteroidales bacterium]